MHSAQPTPPAPPLLNRVGSAILAEHPRTARRWRALLWLLVCVVTVLALSPAPPKSVDIGGDKINHLLAFATLATVAALAWARAWPPVALALLMYGGLIELLQSFTPTRKAEWADLLADATGIGLGLLLAAFLLRWARRAGPVATRSRAD